MGHLIWFALLIPLLFDVILAMFFQKKMAWWEYLVTVPVIAIMIFISKSLSVSSQTKDVEYWNGYVQTATYYEDWDEKVHCRHPKYCTKSATCYSTDKKGRSHPYSCTKTYQCGWYHPYDVDYHPKHWDMDDNLGNTHSISKERYDEISKVMWKNESFKELNRPFFTKDGDAYVTKYNNEIAMVIPVTQTHEYENKVQAASSIYKFMDVDSTDIKTYGLYNYPESYDPYDFPVIMGDNNHSAKKTLQYYNAVYGLQKKMHLMILVYRGKTGTAFEKQKAYWKGSNKNEFVLCVGIDSATQKIEWANVITWSADERLKIDVAGDVMLMQSYDINKIASYLGETASKRFVKKSFKEFNYLTVEPTNTCVTVTFCLTFVLCLGMSIFLVKNGIDMNGTSGSGNSQRSGEFMPPQNRPRIRK